MTKEKIKSVLESLMFVLGEPISAKTAAEVLSEPAADIAKLFRELAEEYEERGRSSGIGRPYLYGTTRRFLEIFGFESLADLPLIEDIDSLTLDDEDFEEPMPDQLTIPGSETV